jgi:beta-lactamase regulating signal transducer with metallopeptidase domain
MIAFINAIAEPWFRYIASATWQATLLALFILGLLRIGRRWPPALRHAFLMLALCKFVVPPMLSLPTGLFQHVRFPRWGDSAPRQQNAVPAMQNSSIVNVHRGTTRVLPNTSLPKPVLTPHAILFLLHFTGTLLVLAAAVRQKLRLNGLVSRTTEVQDPVLAETYDELWRNMKLSRKPRLLISRDNHAPIAFGTWKPVVMLPETLASAMLSSDIRIILGHELAHHCRLDPLTAWFQMLVAAIWWFNPVYWMLARNFRAVREDCCDDRVVSSGIASREAYCRTLLNAARAAVKKNAVSQAAFAYIGEDRPLRRRFERIMTAKIIRVPKLAITGMLMVSAFGLVLLPGVEPNVLAQNEQAHKSHAGISKSVLNKTSAVLDNTGNRAMAVAVASPRKKDSPKISIVTAQEPGQSFNFQSSAADEKPAQDSPSVEKEISPNQDLKAVLASKEAALRALEEYYKPTYPDIMRLKREIAELRKAINEDSALVGLKVAQFYADKRNYLPAVNRLKEILDNYPDFSRIDEVKRLYENLSRFLPGSREGRE